MSNYSNSRESLLRWHEGHNVLVQGCPHCEIDKLRKVIGRFRDAWEDSDSDGDIWERDVEYSRAALFGQVEEV